MRLVRPPPSTPLSSSLLPPPSYQKAKENLRLIEESVIDFFHPNTTPMNANSTGVSGGGTGVFRPSLESLDSSFSVLTQQLTEALHWHYWRLNASGGSLYASYTKMGYLCLITGSLQIHLYSLEGFLKNHSFLLQENFSYEHCQLLLQNCQLFYQTMDYVERLCLKSNSLRTNPYPSIHQKKGFQYFMDHYVLSESIRRPFYRGYYSVTRPMLQMLLTIPPEETNLLIAYRCINPIRPIHYCSVSMMNSELEIFLGYLRHHLHSNDLISSHKKRRGSLVVMNKQQPAISLPGKEKEKKKKCYGLREFLVYGCFPFAFSLLSYGIIYVPFLEKLIEIHKQNIFFKLSESLDSPFYCHLLTYLELLMIESYVTIDKCQKNREHRAYRNNEKIEYEREIRKQFMDFANFPIVNYELEKNYEKKIFHQRRFQKMIEAKSGENNSMVTLKDAFNHYGLSYKEFRRHCPVLEFHL